ncbi:Flp pilus assembly complex ATPase component TadA [Candidatus Woesearchaeota archaeon]|nr:Flp pilus assembly complex ATPase component TadA [Candidatus Woesearchaeota archaeon]
MKASEHNKLKNAKARILAKSSAAPSQVKAGVSDKKAKVLEAYSFKSENIPVSIRIIQADKEFVPIYELSISNISKTTEIILNKIRDELLEKVHLQGFDFSDLKEEKIIEKTFADTIVKLVDKHFMNADTDTKNFLCSYLIQRSLGLGSIELLLKDPKLEEVVINNADEPAWVYHKNHGWLKTNVVLEGEFQIKHYSGIIGRKAGKQITLLDPLMDAHLKTGERVNATLTPISVKGNTMTFRKFASKPWTITDFLRNNTISYEAAATVWLAAQYEMSTIIAGGTATGKTSMLNVFANFFPPNQRILSIEDTRELQLPTFLHWVPMETRLPNPEGKGEVTMLDLLVNSLRMRPDRICVGEIRRAKEAEVLFEAIHTGHSCYATVHANNVEETITRLVSPPINVPKTMLPAVSLIVVQHRNRRTGLRRTFQIAEILPTGDANILLQYDSTTNKMKRLNKSKALMNNLKEFTGMTESQFKKDINEKINVLKYLVKLNVNTVDGVGRVMAEYYTNKDNIMKFVRQGKPFTK